MKNIAFETRADYVELLELLCKAIEEILFRASRIFKFGQYGNTLWSENHGIRRFRQSSVGTCPFWKNGGSTELDDCVVDGIRHGSDPKDAEYWGNFPDGSQAFVEMAPFGYGLLMAPEKIWEPLCEQEKENLNQWLLQINSHFYFR